MNPALHRDCFSKPLKAVVSNSWGTLLNPFTNKTSLCETLFVRALAGIDKVEQMRSVQGSNLQQTTTEK